MNTNFPTVTLYFVLSFMYCKLQVYKKQEPFIRKVLEVHRVIFLDQYASNDWQEIDSRVLLDMVCHALPTLLNTVGLNDPLLGYVVRTLDINPLKP